MFKSFWFCSVLLALLPFELTVGQDLVGNWTWLSGANIADQFAVYGVRGQPSNTSQPGARAEHSMVIDPSGTILYVFGGDGYGASNQGIHSHLLLDN